MMRHLSAISKFMGYMRQFCEEEEYDGVKFLQFVADYGNGTALQFVKMICKKYGEKTGQFTKIKKPISVWCKEVNKLVESGAALTQHHDMKTNDELPHCAPSSVTKSPNKTNQLDEALTAYYTRVTVPSSLESFNEISEQKELSLYEWLGIQCKADAVFDTQYEDILRFVVKHNIRQLSYIKTLFRHWCAKRDFITFEGFRSEMNT
eukprot:763492_1